MHTLPFVEELKQEAAEVRGDEDAHVPDPEEKRHVV